MSAQFEETYLYPADGLEVIHMGSDDVLHDVAEFAYLLPLYEIVPGERSLFLMKRPDDLDDRIDDGTL